MLHSFLLICGSILFLVGSVFVSFPDNFYTVSLCFVIGSAAFLLAETIKFSTESGNVMSHRLELSGLWLFLIGSIINNPRIVDQIMYGAYLFVIGSILLMISSLMLERLGFFFVNGLFLMGSLALSFVPNNVGFISGIFCLGSSLLLLSITTTLFWPPNKK